MSAYSTIKYVLALSVAALSLGACGSADEARSAGGFDGEPVAEPAQDEAVPVAEPARKVALERETKLRSTMESLWRGDDGRLNSSDGPVEEVDPANLDGMGAMALLTEATPMMRIGDTTCDWVNGCLVCCNRVTRCCCYSCGDTASCGQNC